jgi:hypothetical protein
MDLFRVHPGRSFYAKSLSETILQPGLIPLKVGMLELEQEGWRFWRQNLKRSQVKLRANPSFATKGRVHFAVCIYHPPNRLTPFPAACKIRASSTFVSLRRLPRRGPSHRVRDCAEWDRLRPARLELLRLHPKGVRLVTAPTEPVQYAHERRPCPA